MAGPVAIIEKIVVQRCEYDTLARRCGDREAQHTVGVGV